MKSIRTYSRIVLMTLFILSCDHISISGQVQADTIRTAAIDLSKGTAVYGNSLLVYSNSKFQQWIAPEHLSFGRNAVYISDPLSPADFPLELFSLDEPFDFPPGGISFTSDQQTLYLTALRGGKEKIFVSDIDPVNALQQVNFSSTKVEQLPFCKDDHVYMHPAVSAHDKFMVFSSNVPGSLGGHDLYMVRKTENGWGEPANLGKNLNTVQDEIYPFLDQNNNLYFSSDGRTGFGGFDIYFCKFNGEGWEAPVNLMENINSKRDELSIKTGINNTLAFLTSSSSDGNLPAMVVRFQVDRGRDMSLALFESALTEYQEKYGMEFQFSAIHSIPFPTGLQEIAGQEITSVHESEASASDITRQNESSGQLADPGNLENRETNAADTPEAPKAKKEDTRDIKPGIESQQEPVSPAAQQSETVSDIRQTQLTKQDEKPREQATSATEPEPVKVDRNTVFFRIQIVSASKPNEDYRVTIDGKSYDTFQYYYKGAYRFTVGNFTDLDEAKRLQSRCRAAGFSQAFVAAFRNDERVTDPSVFQR